MDCVIIIVMRVLIVLGIVLLRISGERGHHWWILIDDRFYDAFSV